MSYDLEELRKEFDDDKERSAGKGNFGDMPWYSLPEDTTEVKLRFLPSPRVDGKDMVGRLIYKHYSIPEQKSVTCYKTWGLKCPICEMLDKYRGRVELKEWENVILSVFNVLVLSDKQIDPKAPQILTVYGDFTYRWLRDFIFNDEVGDITDVRTGSNVTFQREKYKGKFKRTPSRHATSIGDEKEIQDIMDRRIKLNDIWRNPDEKYLDISTKASLVIEKEILKRIDSPQEVESVVDMEPKTSATPTTTAKAAETTSTPVVTKPANKPVDSKDCFGKYRGDKECDFCTYDFECRKNS